MSVIPSLTIFSEEQKFNGDNLLQWNTHITQLLGAKGLLGYITGTILKPAQPPTTSTDLTLTTTNTPIYSTTPTLDEWNFRDQVARGHITLNCTDVAGLGVNTSGTAKEAYDSIQNEWGRSTDMRRSHAQEALNRTEYAEGTDIIDHIKLLRTRKVAVDNLSSSTMTDETWRGIIIRSIPPTTKWLPVIPSLYTMETSTNIISTLSAHGMILARETNTTTMTGTNIALAAQTINSESEGCTNPTCKAKIHSTHTTANCYWPGGGKEGQFPLDFGRKSRASIATSNPEQTRHFALSARVWHTPGHSGVLLDAPIQTHHLTSASVGEQIVVYDTPLANNQQGPNSTTIEHANDIANIAPNDGTPPPTTLSTTTSNRLEITKKDIPPAETDTTVNLNISSANRSYGPTTFTNTPLQNNELATTSITGNDPGSTIRDHHVNQPDTLEMITLDVIPVITDPDDQREDTVIFGKSQQPNSVLLHRLKGGHQEGGPSSYRTLASVGEKIPPFDTTNTIPAVTPLTNREIELEAESDSGIIINRDRHLNEGRHSPHHHAASAADAAISDDSEYSETSSTPVAGKNGPANHHDDSDCVHLDRDPDPIIDGINQVPFLPVSFPDLTNFKLNTSHQIHHGPNPTINDGTVQVTDEPTINQNNQHDIPDIPVLEPSRSAQMSQPKQAEFIGCRMHKVLGKDEGQECDWGIKDVGEQLDELRYFLRVRRAHWQKYLDNSGTIHILLVTRQPRWEQLEVLNRVSITHIVARLRRTRNTLVLHTGIDTRDCYIHKLERFNVYDSSRHLLYCYLYRYQSDIRGVLLCHFGLSRNRPTQYYSSATGTVALATTAHLRALNSNKHHITLFSIPSSSIILPQRPLTLRLVRKKIHRELPCQQTTTILATHYPFPPNNNSYSTINYRHPNSDIHLASEAHLRFSQESQHYYANSFIEAYS